jgi:hypothetical protein
MRPNISDVSCPSFEASLTAMRLLEMSEETELKYPIPNRTLGLELEVLLHYEGKSRTPTETKQPS